jgi:MOSC domain-containing protein YiiM
VTPKLVAICTGTPTDYGTPGAENPMDRPWRTAFFKYPVEGPRWLGSINVDGDDQAARPNHGGPEKAALAYGARHYDQWRAEYPDLNLGYGAFAENFDIDGLTEHDVCIGDVFRIGEAIVQVTQPRSPCWKITRRWRTPKLSFRVQETGRTGWYLKVLQEAEVEAGMEVELSERPHPEWTIARCNELMHVLKNERDLAGELAALPELGTSWRETLTKRHKTGENPDARKRLVGTNEG